MTWSPRSILDTPAARRSASEPARAPLGRSVVAALRVHQWAKNLLVLVPVVTSHQLTDPDALRGAALAFVAFNAAASALYVVNDLLDLEADRLHPENRKRPFAAGDLSTGTGFVLVPLLLAVAAAVASRLPAAFALVLGGYAATSVMYSWRLKRAAPIDVVVLAGLYALRVFAGATATGIPVSNWLLTFSMFVFLSLALAKRLTELRHTGVTLSSRRAYVPSDATSVAMLGTASGYVSVLVLALYLNSEDVRALYRVPQVLWLACPALIYWISRIWLLAQRGRLQSDPVVFALTDRVTLATAAFIVLLMAAAHSLDTSLLR
jgi:4-hydroxybenzoate polyprenyltransferase